MTALLRMRRDLLDAVQADLSRPHPHAAERVGFLFCRSTRSSACWLSVAFDYVPVADNDYIRDDDVGARIGSSAIRTAMQRVLDTGDGIFHVHRHDHRGVPWFSSIDLRSQAELVPSFVAVGPRALHGALVVSFNDMSMLAWIDGVPSAGRVTVVGQPMSIRRGMDGY